jgi:NADPH-dependent curcumin reductase CurA
LKGAKVLGLAGEDSKVQWLKEELGFDEALNYKDPDFAKKFRAATKDLIDVYFDNGKSLQEVNGKIANGACSWWRDSGPCAISCKTLLSICTMWCHQ